jgi:hypothetical protein
MTQRRGVEGSSSTFTDFPFKKKEVTVTSKKFQEHPPQIYAEGEAGSRKRHYFASVGF